MGGGHQLGDNFQDIINKWVKNHPNSVVIPVHKINIWTKGELYAVQTYVWVMDGIDNLNIELVRNGACNSNTMLLTDEKSDLLISNSQYKLFENKILEAEKYAQSNKLGIWKEKL